MKMQIILICEGGQQFGVVVEEMSAKKAARNLVTDLSNPAKKYIRFADYVPTKRSSQGDLWVKVSTVQAVVVSEISKTQTPNKQLFVPSGRGN